MKYNRGMIMGEKFSWKTVVIIGLVLGSLGGFSVYLYLGHVDSELRLEQSSCGLDVQDTCDFLRYIGQYPAPNFAEAENKGGIMLTHIGDSDE